MSYLSLYYVYKLPKDVGKAVDYPYLLCIFIEAAHEALSHKYMFKK